MSKCMHEETEKSNIIREDGYEVEWNETCLECGKEWIYSYGTLEEKE